MCFESIAALFAGPPQETDVQETRRLATQTFTPPPPPTPAPPAALLKPLAESQKSISDTRKKRQKGGRAGLKIALGSGLNTSTAGGRIGLAIGN